MSADFSILLAEMQADFVDELPDRCDRIEEGVMALEGQQIGTFDELYRQIHSLKGSGGMFGIAIITTICHQFESFISENRHGLDRKGASTALAYVDLLRKTIDAGGRDASGIHAIEQALERMHVDSLCGRASVLLVEPSDTLRKLYSDLFSGQPLQVAMMQSGLASLERMLHAPFDLLVISRELPDLNALAVVAALRESRCRNSSIPVILLSSNPAPVPAHLGISTIVRRDPSLLPTLSRHVTEALAKRHLGAGEKKLSLPVAQPMETGSGTPRQHPAC
jgi:CheY-like chemotaxis protein/HPt (histidine-containing phosphotransfer) domain-containing protein